MTETNEQQQASLHYFMREKAAFDALLARLTAASAEHFGANPESFLWDMGNSVAAANQKLREVARFLNAPDTHN